MVRVQGKRSVTTQIGDDGKLSFCVAGKDGRMIQVGDCALFKSPQDSPPFVGIVCRLKINKENFLTLYVNWLYRPADIKLGKDNFPGAAPNEVFFSSQKDEIPVASLLHPCKVAFLKEGVDLPLGVSSFVCRRGYDIENKCLWWLTDEHYIACCLTQELKEEVDQLLVKTTLEMHGSVQSGGRSPKNVNGPIATPHLKSTTDSAHNSSSNHQVKGRKRERSVQRSERVKRERIFRADDTVSGKLRSELKSEIAKITDKGGLVDFEGVEKLVQLMQPDDAQKKIDLSCRIMLVEVISVTDKFDCLGRFVQLRGLSVLDEWLRDVHKVKSDVAISPKEGDKSVEEFLLVLLRALYKLPVNLSALQTCNIGKSVNHLRTHKNSEIHKKARSLVDTWKKRVEVEMNMLDAKSDTNRGASWPAKSAISEVSHAGSRRSEGFSDVGVKSNIVQSSTSKTLSVKLGSGDAIVNFSLGSPCSTKSAASVSTSGFASVKDINSVTLTGAGSSSPHTTGEEKSSNSGQSQDNNPSFSSDIGKTGASSCREDARSSTARSIGINALASLHCRKSSSGLRESVVSGVENESSREKLSSSNKNVASERVLATKVTSEGIHDLPLVSNGNCCRLVIRLPNSGRSPSQSSSRGSPEEVPSTVGKDSPPVHCEKLDHHDQKLKDEGDGLRTMHVSDVNMHSSHEKDKLASPRKVDGSHVGVQCDGQTGNGVVVDEKHIEVSNATCLASKVKIESRKSYESSFSSINALAESCGKFSEACASESGGDDIGMNLLASVAAGETLGSDVSQFSSARREVTGPDDSCSGNDVKLRQTDEDRVQSDYQHIDVTDGGAMGELGSSVDALHAERGFKENVSAAVTISGNSNISLLNCEEKTVQYVEQLKLPITSYPKNSTSLLPISDEKPLDRVQDGSVPLSCVKEEGTISSEGTANFHEMRKLGVAKRDTVSNSKHYANCPNSDENTDDGCLNGVARVVGANEESPCWSSSESQGDDQKMVSGTTFSTEQKLLNVVHDKGEGGSPPSISCNASGLESRAEKVDDMMSTSHDEISEKPTVLSSNVGLDCGNVQDISGKEVVFGCHHGELNSSEVFHAISKQETDCLKPGSAKRVKLDFDLNEGLPDDDGSFGEFDKVSIARSTSPGHVLSQSPLAVYSTPISLHDSLTVASAVKGPFLPPENPARDKTELGWKGSAATSAFRPAEPRKVLEMSLDPTHASAVDKSTGRQGCRLLDFDLNAIDQRDFDDGPSHKSASATCSSRDWHGHRINLDLNKCDESPEIGHFLSRSSGKLEISKLPVKSLPSGVSSKDELTASRNFDLNDGPNLDEVANETTLHAESSAPFLSYVQNVRMNNMEAGNISSWFPASNPFPAVAGSAPINLGRGGQSFPIISGVGPQRILGMPTFNSPFVSEMYRRPVLSSSATVTFPPAGPFQYPVFPFETNFPLSNSGTSTAFLDSSSSGPHCFPAISSQLVGPTGAISTPGHRQYVMSHPSATSNFSSENRKQGSQCLDLNAGLGGIDAERRDERLPSTFGQLLVAGSQGSTNEQLKMYHMAGEVLKRKEPDCGLEGNRRNNCKHPSFP